ncbi:CDP-alcohol phosphatidyltransferase family protein [Cellulomonas sp. zg-ZUI222]|uniref:CDP-alcohol phosphatidyltransferase family protein n=1 Tax=Cellulomonas wangleii TaxID=2816956 RepID=A0ABX8D3C8_9CELL|nr:MULTISPECIES: CDP-alcohol phosphatidyltransferase family protein [Cellulomonas]MBO0899084.1 CDP-alcohol phosphatidyltransferase family protein [Cellulomonas sp. zg-ZUI22]MBO0919937.1 CDP-alcohol phosphatidyltransferase family protein [Cellulomonas wangleii]MBO0923634.1 CDP-alcohol phosphatidyltransferase family protein [Cellulomonas wangleii]QVI61956.1 CDP-alcohol phosphatidyltransferase family protein [Cellulomonas wangleii]
MPSLYALKPWYTRRLRLVVDRAVARGTTPDVFTAAGVAGAALAGVALALGWWLPALVLLAVRLAGANLDGAVARARGVSRPWGFVLNELGDRASDLLMFAGLAVLAARTGGDPVAGLTPLAWVLVATVAATLPTFVSLAGAGAGAPRLNGGPLGKTERCLLAVVGAAVPALLTVVAVVVVVGSVLTAVVRARRIRHAPGVA